MERRDYKKELSKEAEKLILAGYKDIVFFQPAYNIGGGPFIEAKMAEYLSENTDLNVYFCDYENGYGATLIEKMPKVHLLKYQEESDVFPLQTKSIILTNSTRAILLQRMNPENKLLFWHYETVLCGWHNVFLNNEQKKYFRLLKKNNAVVFHDWSGRDTIAKEYGIEFHNKDYFYITLDAKSSRASRNLVSRSEINVAFLSRLAKDKVCSLYYLIDNLVSYQTEKKKNLHIIGDGWVRAAVEEYCQRYKNEINFIFTGSIPHEQLDQYLIDNIDIVFGVGACVLESAALSIPSAVLLIDTKLFNEEEAFWIYNTKEYCVGILSQEKKDFNVTYTKIHNMISHVYAPEGKEKEGNLCLQYFLENHTNKDKWALDFLSSVNKTTLTFRKLKKLLKFVPYCKISCINFRFLRLPIWKKIGFSREAKGYFFGIPILKIKFQKGLKKTYWLGINLYTSQIRRTYNFPAAQFKDGKKGKQ